MSETWASLCLSMEIAGAATFVVCLLGVPLAFVMARRWIAGKSWLETLIKWLLEVLIMIPLVLPPTVVGYILLRLLGVRGFIGAWLWKMFSYKIVFRFEGAVLAAAVVALPLLYMPAKAAFQNVDRDMEDVSRLFGANRFQMFWHISVPMARRGILSGLVLAFARALGEFGATLMVYGWSENRVTLPISIYSFYEQDDAGRALPAMLVLAVISMAVIIAYNLLTRTAKE